MTFMFYDFHVLKILCLTWCFMISVCERVVIRHISRGTASLNSPHYRRGEVQQGRGSNVEPFYLRASIHGGQQLVPGTLDSVGWSWNIFHVPEHPKISAYFVASSLFCISQDCWCLWSGRGSIPCPSSYLRFGRYGNLPLLRFPASSWHSLQKYSPAISCLHCLNSLSAAERLTWFRELINSVL